jgi:hypothetical protein
VIATSPQLPTLSDHQSHILRAILDAWTNPQSPADLPSLAASLDLTLHDLLAELASPALRPHLESARDLSDLHAHLHAAHARRIAIDALAVIAADDQADPIERRRAATAILRATGAPRAPRREPTPDSDLKTQGSRLKTPPPSLPSTPDALVSHVLRTLEDTDDPDAALTTLHAAFAPGATINDEPVPSDPDDFLDDLDDDLRETLTTHAQYLIKESSTEADVHHVGATFYYPDTRWARVDLHLRPIGGAGILPADGGVGVSPATIRTTRDSNASQPNESPATIWRIHKLEVELHQPGFR